MERAVKEDVRHVIEQAPLCAVGPYAAPLLIWARLAVESGFSVPRVGGQVTGNLCSGAGTGRLCGFFLNMPDEPAARTLLTHMISGFN